MNTYLAIKNNGVTFTVNAPNMKIAKNIALKIDINVCEIRRFYKTKKYYGMYNNILEKR